MGIDGVQSQKVGFLQIEDERKAYYYFDYLCRKTFLEYIANHWDEELVIVIPEKTDLEQYVFNLETMVRDKYNIGVNGCRYKYIFANEIIEKLPTFVDYVVVDPQCYSQECFRYNNLLEHIKGELS